MNDIYESLVRLKDYCQKAGYQGWDPFDGLNSAFFQASFLRNSPLFRMCWIQFFKRSPVNLRSVFRVPKGFNPKGIALFLRGYVCLARAFQDEADFAVIRSLAETLRNSVSAGYSGSCWGYNFDWQSRAFFVPRGTPNVIVSTFAGHALLDVYELQGEKKFMQMAVSVSDFIRQDLNRQEDQHGGMCFSYTPLDHSRIFNASLLASAFLARVYRLTRDPALFIDAQRSVSFCCRQQNADGSWFYGMNPNQRWIDSFHTAYNLEALFQYQDWTGDDQFQGFFEKGFSYYAKNFFTEEGVPKYYHNRIYPVDVHSTAGLISLMLISGRHARYADLNKNVLKWTIRHMQSKIGYFYYQIHKWCKIDIPYIRWTQAWMFYALSFYVYYLKKNRLAFSSEGDCQEE